MSSINDVLNLIKSAILSSITDKAVKKGADKVKEKVTEAFEGEEVRKVLESFTTTLRVQAATEALKRGGRRRRSDNPWVDSTAPKRPKMPRVLFLTSDAGKAICDKKYKKQWKATHGTECPISPKTGRPLYGKGEMLSFVSKVWAELSDEQKAPFEVEYSEAKSAYDVAKKNHSVPADVQEAKKQHKADLEKEKARLKALSIPERPKLAHVLFIGRRVDQLMEDEKAGDKDAKKRCREQAKAEWKAKEVDDEDVQQQKDACVEEAAAALRHARVQVRAWAAENGEEVPAWGREKGEKRGTRVEPPVKEVVKSKPEASKPEASKPQAGKPEASKPRKESKSSKASKTKVVEESKPVRPKVDVSRPMDEPPAKASKSAKAKKVVVRDPDSSDDVDVENVVNENVVNETSAVDGEEEFLATLEDA